MKIAVFAVTDKGRELARRLECLWDGPAELLPAPGLEDGSVGAQGLGAAVRAAWSEYEGLVFITATGIAVRLCAPLLKGKEADPAVVVLDEAGAHAISLVSGHMGGANQLARRIAVLIGAEPVVTTATDISGEPALDVLAKEAGLEIENIVELKRVTSAVLSHHRVALLVEGPQESWAGATAESSIEVMPYQGRPPEGFDAYVFVTDRAVPELNGIPVLLLRPCGIVAGIGCRKGVGAAEIISGINEALKKAGLSGRSLGALATMDLKKGEKGLLQAARTLDVPVRFFSSEELARVTAVNSSERVERLVGVASVCEPAAILAAAGGPLILDKQRSGKVTVALAERAHHSAASREKGRISVVGIGPGSLKDLTPRAAAALMAADTIVGYRSYLQKLESLIVGKKVLPYGMGQEVERCARSLELARAGEKVALVSGGDPGVFGMAGPLLELLNQTVTNGDGNHAEVANDSWLRDGELEIEIIPGVSAFCAGAAALGAPVMNDFALVSLSDLLTSEEQIIQRLEKVAASDLVVVLYNPASSKRRGLLNEAWRILLKHRAHETPVGIVKRASLPDQELVITDLGQASMVEADMNTTIIVGNAASYLGNLRDGDRERCPQVPDRWMVTPRGYRF